MIGYCRKCHQEAYRLVEDGDSVKVVIGGTVMLNVSRQSSVSMTVNCPHGHRVKLVIEPKGVEVGST